MWILASAAIAAMPPDVDLDDIGRWEDNAELLLELPAGCWEWVGEARWDWNVGRWGGSRGNAVFVGRTRDGTWGSVHLEPQGEITRDGREAEIRVYDATEARFAPLVGEFLGARVTVASAGGQNRTEADLAENAEAANILREALSRVTGDAYSSSVAWDDTRGGVVLNRSVSLAKGDRQQIEFQVFFPEGGTLPTALDLRFPATFRTGRLPRWTIRDAEVHVRGVVSRGEVFPTSEAFTFGFGIFGFRFHGAQTVKYRRVTRCPAPVVAPTDPAVQEVGATAGTAQEVVPPEP